MQIISPILAGLVAQAYGARWAFAAGAPALLLIVPLILKWRVAFERNERHLGTKAESPAAGPTANGEYARHQTRPGDRP